jgi:hypothetical protein
MSPAVKQRVWVTLALAQVFGGMSSCFAMASGEVFAILHAAFLALWVGSMMFVFQSRSRRRPGRITVTDLDF